jgi:biopolymer transport protein ExbD
MDLYRRRRIDAQIDMTPMIDTLLQLFMIFLLSASFVASSVQLDLPQAAAEQQRPGKPALVSLAADKQLFLNDAPLELIDLRPRLKTELAGMPSPLVVFRADRTLAYQQVLLVLVEIQATGAAQILLEYEAKAKP